MDAYRPRIAFLRLASIVVALLAGQVALAGNPNPPPGPVGPTMRTLQEIFDAASAAAGQLADDRQGPPWIARQRSFAFLDFRGAIQAPDITPDGLTGQIRLLEVFEAVTAAPPGPGPPGPPILSDIVMLKEVNETTPPLKLTSASRIVLPTAFIRFYGSAAPGTQPYLIIALTNVIIASSAITQEPVAGVQRVVERFSLAFAAISYSVPPRPLTSGSTAGLAPPPTVGPTMATTSEVFDAVAMGAAAVDDRTVGGQFLGAPRLEAFLEIPGLRGPDTTPDGVFIEVFRILASSEGHSVPTGGGGGTGAPVFLPLEITKEVDSASDRLRSDLLAGAQYATATLHFYENGPAGPREWFRISLGTAIFSGFDSALQQHGGILRHVETFQLGFRTIRWGADIVGGLPNVETGWDVVANTPL